MKTFNQYLVEAVQHPDYEVGKIYEFKQHSNIKVGLKVKFLGTRKNRKDEEFGHINSEILGDEEFGHPKLVFEWLEGNQSPSSQGVKGDLFAISHKEAKAKILNYKSNKQ